MNRVPAPAKLTIAAILALLSPLSPVLAQSPSDDVVVIDASKPAVTRETSDLRMGGISPAGEEIGVRDSRYLTLDGKPWLPVMGEFHFSRYPEPYWDEELSKMKAGGVQVVATYVFWIHHEEVEGRFDWSGRRDLRRFLQLCQGHGLRVLLRVGPWCHGEVRNGGFPDWLLSKGATRRNAPRYLAHVRRYFGQIGEQVKGLLWKDGGPIIGVQIENEYYAKGPEAGKAHISELKAIARESGIEAPLYTVTGWGDPDFPAGEVMPVFGGYPDNFWESTLADMPPSGFYIFEGRRDNGEMGGPSTSTDTAAAGYPYLMAEAGGGMQVAYHRRPVIHGDDVAAIALTRLGSGANLYGYYMYHGGANPEGKLTTLQESVAKDQVYDLPTVSYDFQAPLGQFGVMNPAFRLTKMLHQFLNDFGPDLAPMRPSFPKLMPADASDRGLVRAAARSQGDRGFLFVNNYQRGYPLPDHDRVQFQLRFPSGSVRLPRDPIQIPSGAYFIWPVGLDLEGAELKYATAQLLTKVRDRDEEYYFFFAQPGIRPEFAFAEGTLLSIHADRAAISRREGTVYVSGIAPGSGAALHAQTKSGRKVAAVVLTRQQAQDLWKARIAGQDHVFLSPADVFFDAARLHLRAREVGRLRFSVFPALGQAPRASPALRPTGPDGLFAGYAAAMTPKRVPVQWERIRAAAPSSPVKMGRYNAIAPADQDFDRAGAWRILLPAHALDGLSDLFLRIGYAGDVGRLYAGRHLLTDDFYKGTPWEVGLKRFAAEAFGTPLEVRIMPLRQDAPIYMPRSSRPAFPRSGETAEVFTVTAQPEYEVTVGLE